MNLRGSLTRVYKGIWGYWSHLKTTTLKTLEEVLAKVFLDHLIMSILSLSHFPHPTLTLSSSLISSVIYFLITKIDFPWK